MEGWPRSGRGGLFVKNSDDNGNPSPCPLPQGAREKDMGKGKFTEGE